MNLLTAPRPIVASPSMRGWSTALGWAIGGAAAMQGGLFILCFARTTMHLPFQDMLDWIESFLLVGGPGDIPGYIWAFHNEHHLVWVRILTALDVWLFRATGIAFIVAGTLALTATAWMLVAVMRRELRPAPALSPLLLLAPMLLATTASAPDCSVPTNVVYPLTLVCLVGSVVLFDAEAASFQRRLAAVALGVGAALGNGVGLVVWPALVWLGWRSRAGPAWVLGVAAFGAAFGALYVSGMPPGMPSEAGPVSWPQLVRMAAYFLAYLGLPLSATPGLIGPSRILGTALLLAGVAAFLHVSRPGYATSRLERSAVALILLSVGTAALAAIGRVNIAGGIVPGRYALLVAPLHVGLACLVLPALARHLHVAGVLAAGLALSAVLVWQEAATFTDTAGGYALARRATELYYAGERSPQPIPVYPILSRADQITALMRAHGLLR